MRLIRRKRLLLIGAVKVMLALGLILSYGLRSMPIDPSRPAGSDGEARLAPDSSWASIAAAATPQCERTIAAKVVALDQTIVYNRLGAVNPVGMIYALRRDVVDKNTSLPEGGDVVLAAGQVKLRDDKRPRPLTLRMNVGDCLQVEFQNLLAAGAIGDQPATRNTGIHVNGMQLKNSIGDDGSNVGENQSSIVAPGGVITYTFYAEREGANLLYSPVDNVSAEGVGTSAFGLFGAVNVEPRGAEWYRSQVTRQEMDLATSATTPFTDDGHPIMDYDAKYPTGHPFAGLPILKILDGNEIVHSDLTAIVTGPNRGSFTGQYGGGWYPPNPTYPNRNQPFREFTMVFHDEIKAIQAFPLFEDVEFEHTLQSVRDGFAINYGSGGAGAEIIANRLGVGPMYDCVECKYEEFFLTSWAVGDPGMVVDTPANAKDVSGNLIVGPKATKALYPEDPSNVYHSYLNDHVKFRNVHIGKEHHIFHLHAHQWLQTPDDDNSSYLDSQAIGPGSGYSYEIANNGSGNRNKTPGDSIFHCHFYPHFAQCMWALWRVHDTFERGTVMETDSADGLPWPAVGARALPDGEIARGTPIPAIVPIPTVPMAPMPGAEVQIVTVPGQPGGQVQVTGTGNPGYPFFIPGVAGHRPPTPPLDIVDDGGLPRHLITEGEAHGEVTPLDFSKELITAGAQFLPEAGTEVEQAAMAFHEQQWQNTFKPDGTSAQFETNGLPRTAGAPYAEPCRKDNGDALDTGPYNAENPRIYRGADIQLDMKINKAGWHFPQARIISLWDDVQGTLGGEKPPEPFVMRANSGDCIDYYHTNLIPGVYEQDAFQVKTPTDVIGQHIHLVKFDVTSADGSANGFNYEDGTFSPDEVRVRIRAIRLQNGCLGAESGDPTDGSAACPVPETHPYFGSGPDGKWRGARTTVQRWYADPVLNNAGQDRTLGNVYTHDHFGPSTHQQTGLYATLLIEPTGSQWRNPETGVYYGTKQNSDGGPTGWHADILTADPKDSFREFYFEYQDFLLAYEAGRGIDAQGKPIPDPMGAINPPGLKEVGLPDLLAKPNNCPSGQPFVPNGCPEAISAADVGTYAINYRNEPLALRVRDPNTNTQAANSPGDLSFAFSSRMARSDKSLNVQPTFYPPLTNDVGPGDPFTPLMRVYDGDRVKIKLQVGATEEGHNSTIHGIKWLQENASKNSGWRNSQMMGISEQFTFEVPLTLGASSAGSSADYLYSTSASDDGLWNGSWGIMRAYKSLRKDLLTLPSNPIGPSGQKVKNANQFDGPCPKTAPVRTFSITAVSAQALPDSTLVYNPRNVNGGPLHDPTSILYVRTEDLDAAGKLKSDVPIEPLILRAAAGDCLKVSLYNRLPAEAPDLLGFNALPPIVDGFNANDVVPSSYVGLHPQLLAYDVTKSDGANVGNNATQTVAPGDIMTGTVYTWYAGDIRLVNGNLVATPVEFGATNLMSSDRIQHSSKGAIGALIVEPQGATWVEDAGTRARATVTANGISFRDFVLVFHDDINMRLGEGSLSGNGIPLPFVGAEEDAEDSGAKALNYRTEPLWFRLGIPPAADENVIRTYDFTNALSNGLIGGDPVTPVFTAKAGDRVRFRVLQPGGHTRNQVFTLHGHIWPRNPYDSLNTEIIGSTRIGNNPVTEWKGSQEGLGPTNHWDFIPEHGAGGKFGITGDYLYRTMPSGNFYGGMWGIFRVEEPSSVPSGTDLALTMTDSPDPVQQGQNLVYTTVATNGGPENATGVVLTDTLPAGVTFISATPSQGTCSGTGPVTCSLGSLPSGNNATVTFVVNPTAMGTIANTATIKADQADPNLANNTATVTTQVKRTGGKK